MRADEHIGIAMVKELVDTTTVRPVRKLDLNKAAKPLTYVLLKRLADISIALVALAISLPLMVIVSIAIKIESKGPVLYKQTRLGKNGLPFTMVKFRSMYVNAEAEGPRWASDGDDRITKVGSFLRKTRIDEFPQFFQVVTGKMSLVGPRPERPEFYEAFEQYIPGFKQRLFVKPGITGLAQVNGGYLLLPEQKVSYDLEYIEDATLYLDLKIIFSTVKILFSHEGAR